MILVDNYIGAILCCVYCCLCWGSWANTQKMVTSKSWSFELFYWDLTFGLFFTALLGALTLGSLGGEGFRPRCMNNSPGRRTAAFSVTVRRLPCHGRQGKCSSCRLWTGR